MISWFSKNKQEYRNPPDPIKDPSGYLTIIYILALALIAILASMSHVMITQMTGAQKETAEVVYIAGRQRVTAQQVALHISDFINEKTPENKALVENAYFSFKLGHNYLVHGYQEEKTGSVQMSPELHKIYFSDPVNLHREAQNYIALVEEFLELDEERTSERKYRAFQTVSTDLATGRLIKGLDIAAQQYQKEALAKINRLKTWQKAVFFILLFTLFLEAMFIFRPLVLNVKKYSGQLLHMALKDTLTGLDNRRSFMQSAEAELSRARRHKTDLCVILSDIDKFKAVNDTYGHAAGDDVLVHLADILSGMFRKEDIFGRIGGEEFAFILPQTNQEQGVKIIEKLRKKIETTPCPIKKEDGSDMMLPYTSSFGLVFLDNEYEDIDALLKRADAALYEAKETGRNKVAVAKSVEKEVLKAV